MLSLFLLPAVASPIVGAWVRNNGAEGDSEVLVFLANGIYFHAEDSDVDTMQRGRYLWDEETGGLNLTPETQAGDSELPLSFNFSIEGDVAASGEFQRVASETNPFVGGWSFGDATSADTGAGIVVFLENGVYFHAEDIEADPPFEQDGMERGTYSWNPETRDFSATQTADTNGQIGFSDPEGEQRASLFGDSLLFEFGLFQFTLDRVVTASETPADPPLIVGAWVHNNGAEGDSDVLVFLENGIYFHAEDSDVDTMQRGRYLWDEESGDLNLTPETQTGGSELPFGFNFLIVGDSADGGEFQRVVSETNPIVGGWSFGDTEVEDSNSGVLVFLENGVYFNAQDVEADPPFFQDGMERGTFTWDAATRAFSSVQTSDTNGEVGISDPRTPFLVSVQGDDLVIQEGFLKFGLSRATAMSTADESLGNAQTFMVSDDGMFGVMVETVSGFFYTVERSDDLGEASEMAGIEGTGVMSEMVLETDPAVVPRAFFRTQAEVQEAVSSADIGAFLSGQSIDGIVFGEDGTWTQGGDSGEWTYEVTSASEGEVVITSNASGNDPAVERTEFDLDFSDAGNFDEIPVTVSAFMANELTEEREIVEDLEPEEEMVLAPSTSEFSSLIAEKTIKGTNFRAGNCWDAFGERRVSLLARGSDCV